MDASRWAVALLAVLAHAAGSGPTLGSGRRYSKISLESTHGNVHWTLTTEQNSSIQIAGSVPGGVYSDLHRAGVIPDILRDFNDVLTRWVAHHTWTYTGTFQVKERDAEAEVINLVLEGVDTVAFILLNDSPVGTTSNMFVRYVFDIKPHIKVGSNELKVAFASPVAAAAARSGRHFAAPECVPDLYHGECHANQLRKMQASFGWDWGPAFPSVGLWKPAYIEAYSETIIRSVTTHITKEGAGADWLIRVKAFLESGDLHRGRTLTQYLNAKLTLDHQDKEVEEEFHLTFRSDGTCEAELNMSVSENDVSVWWPNGYGSQPLYQLRVSLAGPAGPDDPADPARLRHRRLDSTKYLHIGFRTVEVVEEDASLRVDNATGGGGEGLTFYFRVNGYPLFMKGSNWIPAHVLPEHGYRESLVDSLLSAARDSHMAMLRVWGGGVYESDYFYRRCDQLGILIWQDFLFACSMYPADAEFLDNVKTEIEQTVIRLQPHPSIAVWAGNNENEVALRGNWYQTEARFEHYKQDYVKLYVDTIRPIVNGLDPGRRYLVSSPSNGAESEREGYVAEDPYDSRFGDTHYYNYLADNWDANIYPRTRFASEYGFQSLPSLATMRTATRDEDAFSVHSEYSRHRQHSPNGYAYIEDQMSKHLKLDEDDPKHFEKFIFYSQISQAMAMKAESEYYRQSQAEWYTMGALYWQLNDVWQAPSWSGIEYGGRWKMLHYFAKRFFAPVLVSPRLLETGDLSVYLLNDRFVPIIDAVIKVDVFNYSTFAPVDAHQYRGNADPLSSNKLNVDLDFWKVHNKEEIFLRLSLQAEGVSSSPHNYVFPKPLHSATGLREPHIRVSVSKRSTPMEDRKRRYSVDVTVDTVVLFLWLESDVEGHFEDNGLIITQPHLRIHFVTKQNVLPELLQRSITYQYYVN